ncbi:DNA-binding MarR family transcriptional regulator [Caulobacter ginsengisoli]|uniref:DNA-binding MarR family transcriptional regulator n=1 Tax=Caulobacter ginsengisoli TaxID=400775 RepID=A0ABU0IVS4_9CAUL|nr:MarR family transcriptional regulator [Caulobacter ginsengisoli]MDQ0465238.1 DNA-binding MarR family transcriptional regulator [Caulobacter ginsengisoli]
MSAPHPRRSFANHAVRLGELVLARAEAAVAPLGIRALALDTLVCIKDGYGRSQQDLARRLGIYAPQMVGLIDTLEQKGLVERQVSPADRRRHVLVLTPAGEALLGQGLAIAETLEAELFGAVTAEQKAWFQALVERLEGAAPPLDCK